MISGFVIAYSAEGLSAGEFLKHRIIRLYPSVWICATLTLLATLSIGGGGIHENLPLYLRSMVLLPRGPGIDIIYWTLQIEIIFYALIFGMLWMGQLKNLPVVMSIIGCISAAFWCLAGAEHILGLPASVQRAIDVLGNSRSFSSLLGHHGCFFAAGVILYQLHFKESNFVSLLVLAFCIIGGMLEIQFTVLNGHSKHEIYSSLNAWLPISVWLASVAALTLVTRFNGFLYRRLRPVTGLIRFLGLMTFPLYLIHNNNGVFIEDFLMAHGVDSQLATIIALFTVLAVAIIVTAKFEGLVRKKLKSMLKIGPVMTADARTVKA